MPNPAIRRHRTYAQGGGGGGLSASDAYAAKVIANYSPLLYFRNNEAGGGATTMSNYGSIGSADGSYLDNTIPGATTDPNGDANSAPLFVTASNDYANMYSAAFAAAFNPDDTAFSFWFRNDLDVTANNGQNGWQIQADGGNLLRFFVVSNDTYRFQLRRGGGNAIVLVTASTSGLANNNWHHALMVANTAVAGELQVFINGSAAGTASTSTWAGTGLSSTNCVLGAQDTTPAGTTWVGGLKDFAWIDGVLDATDAAVLASYGA